MEGNVLRGFAILISALAGFFFWPTYWPVWVIIAIAFVLDVAGERSVFLSKSVSDNTQETDGKSSPAEQKLLKEIELSQRVKMSIASPDKKKNSSITEGALDRVTASKASKRVPPPIEQRVNDCVPMEGSTRQVKPSTLVVATVPSRRLVNPMRVAEVVHEKQIRHLVHFTRCDNLPSIFKKGLMSVDDLEMIRCSSFRNDEQRLDGKHGAVSLSISFPNYKMFYKCRRERPNAEWAVLLLEPAILWELDCAFYQMNAAHRRMRHLPLSDARRPEALESMFSDSVMRRDQWLRTQDPTDIQAEVMVFEPIVPKYFLSVVFETFESKQRWACWTTPVETTISGRGRGVFGTRENYLAN